MPSIITTTYLSCVSNADNNLRNIFRIAIMSLRTLAYNAISTPQQSQLHSRRMQETSFGCSPPEPIQFPIWNATANTTTYLEIPQEVHNVEITFNYEIRHWSNVNWDANNADGNEVESDSDGGWFSKLFGGRMLESGNNSTDSESVNGTGSILEQLESVMVTSIWNTILNDPNMSFNNDTNDCAGLVVSEGDETTMTDDVNAEYQAPQYGTKLLGLSVYPADEVNSDGKKLFC